MWGKLKSPFYLGILSLAVVAVVLTVAVVPAYFQEEAATSDLGWTEQGLEDSGEDFDNDGTPDSDKDGIPPPSEQEAGSSTNALSDSNSSRDTYSETSTEEASMAGAPSLLKSIYIPIMLLLGAFMVILSYFARLDSSNAFDGVREDIYNYIRDNPGEHLTKIMREFDLSPSSVMHHLKVLERTDNIVSHKDNKYRRYFINKNGFSAYTNGEGYKHIVAILKNNTARSIVTFLLANPRSTQKRVSETLNLHPSTVNWHASRLEYVDILEKKRHGKEIAYDIKQKEMVRKVMGLIADT